MPAMQVDGLGWGRSGCVPGRGPCLRDGPSGPAAAGAAARLPSLCSPLCRSAPAPTGRCAAGAAWDSSPAACLASASQPPPPCAPPAPTPPPQVAHLKSYENMGKAEVTCTNGCTCERTIIDGNHTLDNSQTFLHALSVGAAGWGQGGQGEAEGGAEALVHAALPPPLPPPGDWCQQVWQQPPPPPTHTHSPPRLSASGQRPPPWARGVGGWGGVGTCCYPFPPAPLPPPPPEPRRCRRRRCPRRPSACSPSRSWRRAAAASTSSRS
jgi:hypothetical protein